MALCIYNKKNLNQIQVISNIFNNIYLYIISRNPHGLLFNILQKSKPNLSISVGLTLKFHF